MCFNKNLKEKRAIGENVKKIKKNNNLSLVSVGRFHGLLNTLLGKVIFKSCVILIVLYTCELCNLSNYWEGYEHYQLFKDRYTHFGSDMPSIVSPMYTCELIYLLCLITTQYDNIAARINKK